MLRKNNFILVLFVEFMFCVLVTSFATFLSNGIFFAIFVLFAAFIALINATCLRPYKQYSASFVFLPVLVSALQNVYLGLLSPLMTSFEIQTCLMFSFIYSSFLVAFLFFSKRLSYYQKIVVELALLIVFYSLVLLLVNGTSFASFVASFRNVLSPFIFCCLGASIKTKSEENKLLNLAMALGWFVCAVGIFELFFDNNMWINLNIGDLWAKKSMSVETWGMPGNFVSSEFIFGRRVRRMVSTFADPVNLGAFLFAIFAISITKNKKVLSIATFFCIVLTVSKGALIGLLFMILVFIFYSKKWKLFFAPAILLVGAFSIGFIFFSKSNSTGSLFAHVAGFTNGLLSLFAHPLGLGLGNVGVLSTLFESSLNSAIIESGFGTICGSLGWFGLVIYFYFYFLLFRYICRGYDLTIKKIGLVLLLAMLFNIMFNEVALSPNSCSLYFLIIGFSINKNERHFNCVCGTQVVLITKYENSLLR